MRPDRESGSIPVGRRSGVCRRVQSPTPGRAIEVGATSTRATPTTTVGGVLVRSALRPSGQEFPTQTGLRPSVCKDFAREQPPILHASLLAKALRPSRLRPRGYPTYRRGAVE